MFKVVLWLLLASCTVYCGENRRRAQFSKGSVYIGGKGSNRQVFIKQGGQTKSITAFKPWEDIQEISLSKDENFLLIYHRHDKVRAFRLTVIDMDSFSIVNSIKPGHGGGFDWTKSNNILQGWGSTLNCFAFVLYNYSLHKLAEDGGYGLWPFLDEDIIVAYPRYGGAAEGIFSIWSLTSGKLVVQKSFAKKVGYSNYTCDMISARNGKLKVQLQLRDDKVLNETIRY